MATTVIRVSSAITRPADTTAYAIADLVANSTTAGSVTPFSWQQRGSLTDSFVNRIILHKSTTSVTSASFRMHLFSATKAVTNGDNGAFAPTTVSNWIGSLTGTFAIAGTAGSVCVLVPDDTSYIFIRGDTIYGLMEARAAYTPGNAEVFTATLEAYRGL